MMSMNSNIRNKINSLTANNNSSSSNNTSNKNGSTSKPAPTNIKVSNSISEKIRKLSSQNNDSQTTSGVGGSNNQTAASTSSSSSSKSSLSSAATRNTKSVVAAAATTLVEKKEVESSVVAVAVDDKTTSCEQQVCKAATSTVVDDEKKSAKIDEKKDSKKDEKVVVVEAAKSSQNGGVETKQAAKPKSEIEPPKITLKKHQDDVSKVSTTVSKISVPTKSSKEKEKEKESDISVKKTTTQNERPTTLKQEKETKSETKPESKQPETPKTEPTKSATITPTTPTEPIRKTSSSEKPPPLPTPTSVELLPTPTETEKAIEKQSKEEDEKKSEVVVPEFDTDKKTSIQKEENEVKPVEIEIKPSKTEEELNKSTPENETKQPEENNIEVAPQKEDTIEQKETVKPKLVSTDSIETNSSSSSSSSTQNNVMMAPVSGEQSPVLAEEEDSSVSSVSATTTATSAAVSTANNTTPTEIQHQQNHVHIEEQQPKQPSSQPVTTPLVDSGHHVTGSNFNDPEWCKRKLAEAQFINQQLKLENDHLHDELQAIRHEMEELQDQFRLDDADEFRQLQAELEIAAKNCRILQFKLRKIEKRNESLEGEKILFQDKLDELSREASRVMDLEEELLIAKEVSIRLHTELEQAQEWRNSTDLLNKELKKQLDELKDYLDNEIKGQNSTDDFNELVLVNKLYESMFREYFLQEQLYTLSNNSQEQNVSKQLREVTDLLNSYQQKISLLNEEIDLLKQQVLGKDKELEQYRIQVKNLKRSRSSDSTYDRSGGASSSSRRSSQNSSSSSSAAAVNSDNNPILTGKSGSSSSIEKTSTSIAEIIDTTGSSKSETPKKSSSGKMSASSDNLLGQQSDATLGRQLECANDEIRLLRNKIARLEDDLSSATQERDSFSLQLEKIEDKAMKSFTMSIETEKEVELELDAAVIKQMTDLKKKIDDLNTEAKKNEEIKENLSKEINDLRDQLTSNKTTKMPSTKNEEKDAETEKAENAAANLTDADKLQSSKSQEKVNDDKEEKNVDETATAELTAVQELTALKRELAHKDAHMSRMQSELQSQFSQLNELKKLVEIKEGALSESQAKEASVCGELETKRTQLVSLNQRLAQFDEVVKDMRARLDDKMSLELALKNENERLESKIASLSQQVQEKASEIEFLNRESNALLERANTDETRAAEAERETGELRSRLALLQADLDKSRAEVTRLEALASSSGRNTPQRSWTTTTSGVKMTARQLDEFDKTKKELVDLKDRYTELSDSLGSRVVGLTAEIERLNKDKEQLQGDLVELREKYEHALENKKAESTQYLSEQDQERLLLEKFESQALNTKYEAKIQYLEVEIDTLRSKIRKLIKEKEIQDQVLKETQQLMKDIALKYSSDSESWNRQKQKLLEKEKLYEESVEMRKELKKAADKLRQKLQSLEEQIIEKQNKYTMEKNSWETQRIQFLSVNNRLEEQLSKLSTLKRSKKEIEFAWDKERRELIAQMTALDAFARDLQGQLAQAKLAAAASLNAASDQYALNERLQSLTGENEFLKNRIRELELMLEELEQVKRFLIETKQVYDNDRMEWDECKRDLTDELIQRDLCQREWDAKMAEMVRIVRALISNEPLASNTLGYVTNSAGGARGDESSEFDMYEERDRDSMASINNHHHHHHENTTATTSTPRLLSSLVGGTASLLDGAKFSPTPSANQIAAANSTAANKDDLRVIDMSRHKQELDTEFEQVFKKINRVKDNYSTHKKFMDIVKSKSMKALNRKSSITSLPHQQSIGGDSFDTTRGSMPPEAINGGQNTTSSSKSILSSSNARAKSVSKEPSSDSNQTMPSRFFSLSRRLGAKIRFSSSSQPPNKQSAGQIGSPLSAKSATNLAEDLTGPSSLKKSSKVAQSQQLLMPAVSVEDVVPAKAESAVSVASIDDKKNLRERALSPSRIFRSLRPRSPFGRSHRAAKSASTATTPTGNNSNSNSSNTTVVSGTSVDASGKNKSFTVSTKSSDSPSTRSSSGGGLLSRFTRANTTVSNSASNTTPNNTSTATTNDSKTRSLSCEFIDSNTNNTSRSTPLKQLDERDEYTTTNTTPSSTSAKHLGYSSLNKVDYLRKSFMESTHSSQCSNDAIGGASNFATTTSTVVKSVKFKDPPENTGDEEYEKETTDNGVVLSEENDTTNTNSTTTNGVQQQQQSPENEYMVVSETTTTTSIQLSGKKTSPVMNSTTTTTRSTTLKGSASSNSVDKPLSGLLGRATNKSTNNSSSSKSKTIDFPDLLQSTMTESTPSSSSGKLLLTPSGRPIQSILRRSETPPTTKASLRQTSLDSAESSVSAAAGLRETSIEKLLKSTSTSRPLIFNS